MGILITEKWSARRGKFDANLRGWVQSAAYEVSGATDSATARNAVNGLIGATFVQGVIPVNFNDPHPSYTHLRCTSIEPAETGFNFFTVAIQWTLPPGGDATSSDIPLNQPLKICWEPGVWSEPSEIDAEGNPILNMAGDPVEPPVSLEKKTTILVVKKWQPYYDPVQAVTFQNAINQDQFTIAAQPQAIVVPPGQCMCQSIRPEEEYTLYANFVVCSYRFAFRPNNTAVSGVAADAWDIRLLNAGYNGWFTDPSSGSPAKGRLYFKGSPVGAAVPLDATGKPVGPGFTVSEGNYPVIANPHPPVVGTNVDIETRTVNGVSLTYLHYLRGIFLPFAGLV